MRWRLIPSLLGLAVGACSGIDVMNAMVPTDGYTVRRDVPYGAGPRRTLDVYMPDRPAAGRPVVVFYYGGSWQSGSKDDYLFVGQALAARGYVTVIPDYRVYPEARFPDFLEDAAAAAAWARANAVPGAAKPSPVALVGHSAGAYNAVMLALDPSWLAGAGVQDCDAVASAVGLAGPYDFLPLRSPTLRAIFGPERLQPATQPVNYVDGSAPPLLLLSGTDDNTVYPRNSTRLASLVRAQGGVVEERYYTGTGHISLVASLGRPLRGMSPALADIDAFIARHADGGRTGCVAEARH